MRGLLLRQPHLDVLRVQDTSLHGEPDPIVLAWAAIENRIVLTHDRATMPNHAYERVIAGLAMPGVFVVNDRLPVGQAIDQILLINEHSNQAEWNSHVLYLPL